MSTDAILIINDDGTYADASPAALDILGVSLTQLRAAEPGMFAADPTPPDEDAAFRTAWKASGSPDIAGETTIRRGDGAPIRVRFVVALRDDGRFLAVLDQVDPPRSESAPTKLFTLGEVLGAWRAAERRLESIPPDAPEWAALQSELHQLRDQYQQLFEARRGGPHRP